LNQAKKEAIKKFYQEGFEVLCISDPDWPATLLVISPYNLEKAKIVRVATFESNLSEANRKWPSKILPFEIWLRDRKVKDFILLKFT